MLTTADMLCNCSWCTRPRPRARSQVQEPPPSYSDFVAVTAPDAYDEKYNGVHPAPAVQTAMDLFNADGTFK